MNLCIAPQLSANVTDVHMQACVCVLSRVVICVGFVSFAVSRCCCPTIPNLSIDGEELSMHGTVNHACIPLMRGGENESERRRKWRGRGG